LFFKSLIKPGEIFKEIAQENPEVLPSVVKFSFLLVFLPPIFAWIGASTFGWRLGAQEPIFLDSTALVMISFFYADAICLGFFSTVLIARWMGGTYGGEASFNKLFAFFTVVTLPLVIGSAAHLFPHAFFNLLILIPVMICCMNLLYRGLAVVLNFPPERGMLM